MASQIFNPSEDSDKQTTRGVVGLRILYGRVVVKLANVPLTSFFAKRWNIQLDVEEKTWELCIRSASAWVKMQRIGK